MNTRLSNVRLSLTALATMTALGANEAVGQIITPNQAAGAGACIHAGGLVNCPPGFAPGSQSLFFSTQGGVPGSVWQQFPSGPQSFVNSTIFQPFVLPAPVVPPPVVVTPTPPTTPTTSPTPSPTPGPTPSPIPIPPTTSSPPPVTGSSSPSPLRSRLDFFPSLDPARTPPLVRPETPSLPIPQLDSGSGGSELFGASTQNFTGPGRNDFAIALLDPLPGTGPFAATPGADDMLPQLFGTLFSQSVDLPFSEPGPGGPGDPLLSQQPRLLFALPRVGGVYNNERGVGFRDLLIDGASLSPPGQLPEPIFVTLPENPGFELPRGGGIAIGGTPAIGGAIIAGNTAGTPGDFDGDGNVDAADYMLWSKSFGSKSDLRADGNGDGVVNAADYTLWKDHFGNSTAGAGNAPAAAAQAQGGGIFVQDGRTGLTDSTVPGNTPDVSPPPGQGGGIFNDGGTLIAGSTISGNTPGSGGGIFNDGEPSIPGATISGNTPGSSGGGIVNDENLSLPNSTISGNTPGSGGGILNDGGATLSGSTFSGNAAAAAPQDGAETAQQDARAAFLKSQAESLVHRLNTGTPEEIKLMHENLRKFANDELKAAYGAALTEYHARRNRKEDERYSRKQRDNYNAARALQSAQAQTDAAQSSTPNASGFGVRFGPPPPKLVPRSPR